MPLVSIVLGAVFLALALPSTGRARAARPTARRRQLFGFSILYLFGLFAALLVERSARL